VSCRSIGLDGHKMNIVGGAYIEICQDPSWYQLFGSGVRAAAALSQSGRENELNTYIHDAWRGTLEATAETFAFRLALRESPQTPQFDYRYPVATPSVWQSPDGYREVQDIVVEAEHILRFGMLEREAVVRGKRVTYDPQSERFPKHFHANGSTAEHLAIVANEAEVVALTGTSDPRQAGEALLQAPDCDVVVVKRGAHGALVVTRDGVAVVPAFRTPRVWPIGSGDVFSALFGHFWGELAMPPFEAALRASRGTAQYCETQVLPIDISALEEDNPATTPITPSSEDAPQVYLAGPFFTLGERWVIAEVRRSLGQQGVRVFSPLHDVGFGSAAEIGPKDLEGLRASQSVIAVLDGLDAGTVFEVGYARALGIPVVVWSERTTESDLVMMRGSGCVIIDDLSTAIYHAAWAALESQGR